MALLLTSGSILKSGHDVNCKRQLKGNIITVDKMGVILRFPRLKNTMASSMSTRLELLHAKLVLIRDEEFKSATVDADWTLYNLSTNFNEKQLTFPCFLILIKHDTKYGRVKT
jgi:hypothetical protein